MPTLENVLELDRHGLDWSIEDARVVHIVPSIEQIVSAFEFLKLLLPKLPRVFIQKVNERRIAWPCLHKQSLVFFIAHENVLGVVFIPL